MTDSAAPPDDPPEREPPEREPPEREALHRAALRAGVQLVCAGTLTWCLFAALVLKEWAPDGALALLAGVPVTFGYGGAMALVEQLARRQATRRRGVILVLLVATLAPWLMYLAAAWCIGMAKGGPAQALEQVQEALAELTHASERDRRELFATWLALVLPFCGTLWGRLVLPELPWRRVGGTCLAALLGGALGAMALRLVARTSTVPGELFILAVGWPVCGGVGLSLGEWLDRRWVGPRLGEGA